jgi:RNA polymerase sigma-70 factor (ECF subfamily)
VPVSDNGSVVTPVITTADTIRNFETFFSAHRNSLIRALAMSLNDHALATEAVDEAMTRAVQHWGKVSKYNKPEGWVYRVAMNWATSRFRRRKRDRDFAPKIARVDHHDSAGFDADVQQALTQLSDDHRSVLVLRYFFDWDVQSTASALEISTGTVKSRTSRALEAMSHLLDEPLPTSTQSTAPTTSNEDLS